MAELASFRLNRRPQRTLLNRRDFLDLGAGGSFLTQLRDLVERAEDAAPAAPAGVRLPVTATRASAQAVAENGARGFLAQMPEGMRALLDPDPASPPPGDRASRLLLAADEWLLSTENEPEPAELDEALKRMLAAYRDDDEVTLYGFALGPEFDRTFAALVDVLSAAVLVPDRSATAQQAARLLLVAGLIRDRLAEPRPFASRAEIRQLLRHRTPVLPNPPFPQLLRVDRTELVRKATVADLFVVRSEWRCYEAAEIADITNVHAGETFEARRVRIDEREITETGTEERAASEEQEDEASERSEISEETQREISLAVHADGQVNTSGQYGATHVDTSVGVSADFSISDSTRRATQLARQSTSRALARVETRTRTERIERILARTELSDVHQLSNTTGDHVRGVYRWVNRIDRYQVVRYPDRLLLEFQLPEPGNALARILASDAPGATEIPDDPGEFDVTLDQITRDSWAGIVAERNVVGVTAPPDAEVAIAATLFGATTTSHRGEDLWMVDPVETDEDVSIPPGYEAFEVSVAVDAHPMLAKFVREYEDANGVERLENFHSIDISVSVGGLSARHWHPGPAANTIQQSQTQRGTAAISWVLPVGSRTLPNPVRDRLPVTIVAAGAESLVAAVSAKCRLTTQAFETWRQGVYDALSTAHTQATREYRDAIARVAMRGSLTLRERAPARNTEMIREELRRQVISWLTNESPFPGRPAVLGATSPADENIHIAKARTSAPEIQFLEQAFEWQNLVYVAYPYYWARPATWDARRKIETVDTELGRFLRAGSVRVVVPARPGFQDMVTHWLTFRQPWGGTAPPQPNDPLYLSIAREVRDQLLPPEDGIPDESWEARVPTTMRWLDKQSSTLPHNTIGELGAPPHEPERVLCRHEENEPDD